MKKGLLFLTLVLLGTAGIAALTADRSTPYRAGDLLSVPVYRSTTIYKGSLVSVNSSGYAIPASDSANTYFVGVAENYVVNSGSDGDKSVTVRTKGQFKFPATSISQAHLGSIMYVKDDQTFDNTSTNLIPCGRLVEYVSATEGWIEIQNALTVGATIGGSAVSLADAGNHFATSEDTAEAALQRLSKNIVVTIPRFTGWTKDGSAKTQILPALELPSPVRITRAYLSLQTRPGAGKTVTVLLNGTTVAELSGGTDYQAENESLDIPIAANTDWIVTVAETASGAGANADLILVGKLDDGED
jgi:hypothetical protein